ncbi:ribose utilization transcriptional repressor RbsR [Lacticaseibacillus daqingensis]|uniref:ribose utilization transcriptional repressor RbsR n=1 Tax=Lacticaseibacillus daqingensis TaxID=2486014 RepID=UPI000F793A85|nr:LacI family DNA-binding transcriptional regulator [Lacticaseibacillus daqingensis]
MTTKKVTIREVAQASGVSIATVSQILNGKTKRFTPQTITRVRAARDQLGYEPDYFAQRMITKDSKTIGVIVPDITNPFFGQLLRGIEAVLFRANYITMLCDGADDRLKERDYLDELTRRGVDGFIISSAAVASETLREKQRPFIVLDQKMASGTADAVLTDDRQGGRLAAEHLAALGHQRVAMVLPAAPTANIARRLAGFQTVFPDALQIDGELSKQGGRAAAKALVQTDATAVFAANDEIAFGLYLGLAELGKRVPEDYSVIGYDDTEMAEYVTPQLTTIAQPITALGATTAEMLLARIAQPDKVWEERLLGVELVKRFSAKPL